jgi:cell wall assembly regulator SMI1
MNEMWDRIVSWYAENVPRENALRLAPGASQQQVNHVETELRVSLPRDVRESYFAHDGSNGLPVFGTFSYLSLEGILRECKLMAQMMSQLEVQMKAAPGLFGSWDTMDLHPGGPIQPVWWSAAWVPMLCAQSGHFGCIDLQPAEGGQAGQLFERRTDIGPDKLLADSFRDFFAKFLADLEAGKYSWDPVEGELRKARKRHNR